MYLTYQASNTTTVIDNVYGFESFLGNFGYNDTTHIQSNLPFFKGLKKRKILVY